MSNKNQKVVSYKCEDGIATITIDDGGNNLVTPTLVVELNAALDQARKDKAIVILTGREEVLSAGFDLKVMEHGVRDAFAMLIGGFKLCPRILSHPMPVIVACNGHAIAMGVFLLVACDYRIAVRGDYKILANEVEIGLTMPFTAVDTLRHRLAPAHFTRAVLLSECFDPEGALEAGFIDKLVDRSELRAEALRAAEHYKSLDFKAHHRSKLRSRKALLKKLKWAVRKDRIDIIRIGLSRLFGKS